jgi:hypothetical protein
MLLWFLACQVIPPVIDWPRVAAFGGGASFSHNLAGLPSLAHAPTVRFCANRGPIGPSLAGEPLSCGLEANALRSNNGGMFKQSQIYGWESEPADERPSAFTHSTTHAPTSGYHDPGAARRAALRRPARFGAKSLLAFSMAVLVLGAYGLLKLAPLLHGLAAG